MEKAHPQIWDAFLPVFDEGYIVDGSTNQKVDMTNTIIVLTSNLLTDEEGLGDIPPFELKERIASKASLRTELLGRINEILVFNRLNRKAIAQILRNRLDAALWSLSEQGIRLQVEEVDIARLVDEVQKAKFGVRQIDDVVRTYLRRAISQKSKETSA
jgi:ATP-dependent Clp protease ATP-binding subunit ClpB